MCLRADYSYILRKTLQAPNRQFSANGKHEGGIGTLRLTAAGTNHPAPLNDIKGFAFFPAFASKALFFDWLRL
jgi:hypothetical protein